MTNDNENKNLEILNLIFEKKITIDFKYEFYKYISNLKFNYKHNLTISACQLFFLTKSNNFYIIRVSDNQIPER